MAYVVETVTVNIGSIQNEELIELLFTKEDRITKGEAFELIRRGSEIVPMLSDIVMDRIFWIADMPEWWAPVHATYILGAIGGEETLIPLLSALRWSDAYDNDWVTEDLPSILGSLGRLSYEPLISVLHDRSAGWSARSIAMDALGSHALRRPDIEEEVISLVGRVFTDRTQEYGARRSAAYLLLDFRRSDFKRQLVGFAKEDMERAKMDAEYIGAFTPKHVEQELALPRRGLGMYMWNWLEFYELEEINKRNDRWTENASRSRMIPSTLIESEPGFIIGKNDPCPCGSGKSYKRCCWKKLH